MLEQLVLCGDKDKALRVCWKGVTSRWNSKHQLLQVYRGTEERRGKARA